MDATDIIRNTELFNGLSDEELGDIISICREKNFSSGQIIVSQSEPGDDLYIITTGFVDVLVSAGERIRDLVHLGVGQVFGEMALVDSGLRSATVKAISSPTIVQAIHRDEFESLMDQNNHIGYVVMRNLASDISFKLRHRNLSGKE